MRTARVLTAELTILPPRLLADTLRACLTQLSSVDEEIAQKTLHILEGLNAASSAGESEDEDGDAANGSWLDAPVRGSRAGHGGASDSD